MRRKLRCEVKVQGWYFPSMPGLVWHSGKFWMNHKEVPVVYNNGSRAILLGNTKYGIKKLRKDAQSCVVTILDDMPF
ncbi:MAG: hypothetical protein BGO32_08725 [Bacteroidetes bacterium 37-13]|nr:MAG: hypothetical protein BGO32_08725 [Bacteroidetes bacterium 37-13]